MTELKEVDKSISILGDFSIHFSVTDRTSRQKVDMIIKLGLVEISRTLHLKTAEYRLFPSIHGHLPKLAMC